MLTRTLLFGYLACVALAVTAGCASRPSPSERSSPAAERTPSGTVFTDAAGQFKARFPRKPIERQEPGSIGGTGFIVYAAATTKPSPLEVGCESIGSPQPSANFQATMRVADGSFASAADLNVKTEVVTRFRGRPARQGTFGGRKRQKYTLLTFFYSRTRLYFIFGTAGRQFQGLSQSFVALS